MKARSLMSHLMKGVLSVRILYPHLICSGNNSVMPSGLFYLISGSITDLKGGRLCFKGETRSFIFYHLQLDVAYVFSKTLFPDKLQ